MTAEISLRDGRVCLVDSADIPLLSQFKWWATKGGRTSYAITLGADGKQVAMHTMLMPEALEIDHINGDGLDNRRANIRACSHAENSRNRRKHNNAKSRFKGVWPVEGGRWRAQIEQNGEKLPLGTFDTEVRAAAQYDRAARLFFGAFARTNEMLGLYTPEDIASLKEPRIKQPEPAKAEQARKPVRWATEMLSIGIIPRVARKRA